MLHGLDAFPNQIFGLNDLTYVLLHYVTTHTHTHTQINAEAALFLPVHSIASICIHTHKQPQQSKTRTVLYRTNMKSNGSEIFDTHGYIIWH